MMENKILYIISGRSFVTKNLGRKISEVIKCWQKSIFHLDIVSGGDVKEEGMVKDKEYGAQSHFNKSYSNKRWLVPLVITFSELKDISHDLKFYFKIKSNFATIKYDLIWERSSRLHIAGLVYAKKMKVPFVLEWKDNLVNYKWSFFKPLALVIEKIKINKADFIVVESKVLKDELANLGVDRDRILVAYNAVNAEEFKPSEEKRESYRLSLGVKEDDILVGYLGSYAFYHDTKRLILAAQIIKNQG
jgi:glycosyltransferase involved in cell wall biosynthesis